MRRIRIVLLIALVLIGISLLAGCSEDLFIGERATNRLPEIWLSSGPVEGDTTGYQVHFYWGGWDPDGEIIYYEFVIAEGDPLGFQSEDTMGLDKWNRTGVHDSVFRVTANASGRTVRISDNDYTRYDKTHTFFIRAVDNEGVRSSSAFRSFTAWTLAPYIEITHPDPGKISLAKVTKFQWTGRDPIDLPSNSQDPESVRYLVMPAWDSVGFVNWINQQPTQTNPDPTTLNRHPEYFERKWSPWIYYRAEGDSGRETTIGDDEILALGKYYLFAVQAKDEAGAVTSIFTRGLNAREYVPAETEGPKLTLREPFLGTFQFMGTKNKPRQKSLPPGIPLNFSWDGDASAYGGIITGYRYGWDIKDLNDPSQWAIQRDPYQKTALERKLYSGIHTFYIECVDNGNVVTLGQILIEVVEFTMERNLLFVDDFLSNDNPYPPNYDYSYVRESEHDQFWYSMLVGEVPDFNTDRDTYDCIANNNKLPEIALVGKYKNIIWLYTNSGTCWEQIVMFTPEGQIQPGVELVVNYLPLFLVKGGHLMTVGRADRTGAISSTFNTPPEFPVSLKREMNVRDEDDTSGVRSLGYKDYCITMVDKVRGTFKTDPLVIRNRLWDGLRNAYRDPDDLITLQYPGLPAELTLRPEVVGPTGFARVQLGGFYFVEVYNPEFWMEIQGASAQDCYHPMFRMRAINTRSQLNNTAIALWITKYADIKPEPKEGIAVAAKSFHFGFPFWWFDHTQMGRIVDVVLTEWQINSTSASN